MCRNAGAVAAHCSKGDEAPTQIAHQTIQSGIDRRKRAPFQVSQSLSGACLISLHLFPLSSSRLAGRVAAGQPQASHCWSMEQQIITPACSAVTWSAVHGATCTSIIYLFWVICLVLGTRHLGTSHQEAPTNKALPLLFIVSLQAALKSLLMPQIVLYQPMKSTTQYASTQMAPNKTWARKIH
jgi:hypothetical protein